MVEVDVVRQVRVGIGERLLIRVVIRLMGMTTVETRRRGTKKVLRRGRSNLLLSLERRIDVALKLFDMRVEGRRLCRVYQ